MNRIPRRLLRHYYEDDAVHIADQGVGFGRYCPGCGVDDDVSILVTRLELPQALFHGIGRDELRRIGRCTAGCQEGKPFDVGADDQVRQLPMPCEIFVKALVVGIAQNRVQFGPAKVAVQKHHMLVKPLGETGAQVGGHIGLSLAR